MNEELIKIFNIVCTEYQHILDKFKILATFETLLIAIVFNYIFNNLEEFNISQKVIFYIASLAMLASFLILVLTVTPQTKHIIGINRKKNRKKSGNIFDINDISIYDNIEYLEILKREQVISVKTANFSQRDLSQAASIIRKAHSAIKIVEILEFHFWFFLTYLGLMFLNCLTALSTSVN